MSTMVMTNRVKLSEVGRDVCSSFHSFAAKMVRQTDTGVWVRGGCELREAYCFYACG